jgi:hypothetical protein
MGMGEAVDSFQLAEHLGLRTQKNCKWIADAGLTVVEKLDIAPKHAKVATNLIAAARVKEVTSLYRLKPI